MTQNVSQDKINQNGKHNHERTKQQQIINTCHNLSGLNFVQSYIKSQLITQTLNKLKNNQSPVIISNLQPKCSQQMSGLVKQQLSKLVSQNNVIQFENIRKNITKGEKTFKMQLDKLKQIHQESIKNLKTQYTQQMQLKQRQIETQRDKANKKIQQLEKRIQQLQNNEQDIQFTVSSKDERNKNLESEKNKLIEQNKLYKAQVSNLKSQKSDKEKELKSVLQANQKFTTDIQDKQKQLTKRNNIFRDIYQTIPIVKNNSSAITLETKIKLIQERVDESTKIRQLYSTFNQNFKSQLKNPIEICRQTLKFYETNKKILQKTSVILGMIIKDKLNYEIANKYKEQEFIPCFTLAIQKLFQQLEMEKRKINDLKRVQEQTKQKYQNIQNNLNKEIITIKKQLNQKDMQLKNQQKQKADIVDKSQVFKLSAIKKQLNIQDTNRTLGQRIEQLQINNRSLEVKLSNQQKQKNKWKTNYTEQNIKFNDQVQAHDNIKLQYERQIKAHNKTKQQMKQNSVKLTTKITELEKINQNYEDQIIKVKSIMSKQQNDIRKLTEQLSNANNTITKLQKDLKNARDEIAKMQYNLTEANNKIKSLYNNLDEYRRSKNTLEEKLAISESQHNQQIVKINSITQQLTKTKQNSIKNCEMFAEVIKKAAGSDIKINLDQIQKSMQECYQAIICKKITSGSQAMQKLTTKNAHTLIKALQRKTGRLVKGLKLLYKRDPLNSVNFHSYLDNQNNLLMVVSLCTQCVVGGFTSQPINKPVMPGVGFIFSLSQNKDIILQINQERQTARVVMQDDYQIIFGNSELRLVQNSKHLVCNIGILAQSFNSKMQKIPNTQFLGTSKKEQKQVDMRTYEFYQVQFE